MANMVYIATSLDGFIADRNNKIDWLVNFPNDEDTDYGYSEFISGIDCILMGRKTFQTVLSFGKWPYKKPLFVLTNTLKEIPKELNQTVFLANGNPIKILKNINAKGFRNIYIDGGKTIQSFIELNLIDEYYLSTVPIILGGGITLFSETEIVINLKHIKTEIYNNGIIKSHYSRIAGNSFL